MSGGPESWAQPQGGHPIIDDVQFVSAAPVSRTPVAGGAHLMRMWDGSGVVQAPFLAAARSEAPQFYEFAWDQDGATESEWRVISKAQAAGVAVELIPMLTEHEVFTCAAGTNNFTLTRPTAISGSALFNSTAFPDVALVDGAAQTIVTSGSPATGEVDIQASAVITASDVTVGQVLEIIYYPAYSVLLPRLPLDLPAFNSLRRRVVVSEAA